MGPFRLRRAITSAVLVAALLPLTGCGKCDSPACPSDPSEPAGSDQATLPIPGAFQETAVWCWVGVAEMTFRYYGEPNLNPFGDYQCGIVGVSGSLGVLPFECSANCTLPQCIVPIGSGAAFTTVLEGYPVVARQNFLPARLISVANIGGPLSYEEVVSEISRQHPIAAGINPSGIPSQFGPAHVALIVGYDRTFPGGRGLVVNDPFPYGIGPLGPYGDPYLQRNARYVPQARYLIDYDAFRQGLLWSYTAIPQ
jgi:hypothetical protein